jgi:DNA-binding winged helix-turn-helix (wHTH) protein/Flp pilus assembly protein TadD
MGVMADRPNSSASHAAFDLARADGFLLGPLAVDPPSRRICFGERSEMLEPRVMRVLVAFGEAGGKVLSRDDLIAQCWDGVVVGDNAINQVISRLRHVFADLIGGAVRLETITKVGFRLVVDGQAAGAGPPGNAPFGEARQLAALGNARGPAWPHTSTRRAIAIGLAGAGVAAALGYAGWFRPGRHVLNPRAVELRNRGQAILMAGVPETASEAIKLYRQAVAIEPRYADAWAGLAIGLRYPNLGPIVRLSDPREVRAAAGRALALDSGNADARLALIAAEPLFRRWLERELQLRAFLGDHPDSALGNVMLCWLLLDVGRFGEALAAARRVVEIEPGQQIGWILQVFALSNAGRSHEADLAFEAARKRWPQDPRVWFVGSIVLSTSKRYAEAVAYLRDKTRRPAAVPEALVESVIRQTEALATGRGIDAVRNTAHTSPAASQIENFGVSLPMLVQFGMADAAFALIEAFYFGGMFNGTRVPPPGPLDPRSTMPLFAPTLLALRGDPRFVSLPERIGLEDYWRKSGTQPDFRRRA